MSRRKHRKPDTASQTGHREPSVPQRRSGSLVPIVMGVAGIAVLAALWWSWDRENGAAPVASNSPPSTAARQAHYVDEQQCASCHASQADRWRGSHHDLAMQEASESTVLGNFDDAIFTKDGVRTRFFRRDGKFWINTDGPDGKPADFEVKYTFGVEPLQQYLLPLDRGRLQAFTVAWDTQRRRWFHLYPGEHIDHRDELHWTRPSQNWNFMCAECHSTELKKNYDAETQSYQTAWKQIDVGCQACHGPASEHVQWSTVMNGEARGANQRPTPAVDSAHGSSLTPRASRLGFTVDLSSHDSTPQIDTCARCHSRRATLTDDYLHGKPLLDTHLPSLLEASLYFADGQIEGEVYEYGSFLQSKMHQKGVRCSDCHEPHSLALRAPGNALCASCHNASAPAARASIDTSGLQKKNYDSVEHHFHEPGQPGSQCVDCHAPQRTYMVVDPRRDHSFRIPRPDLSSQLATPNACNSCHTQESTQWAADAIARRYGLPRHDPTFGEILHAVRQGRPGSVSALTSLARDAAQPSIVRATAMQQLRLYPVASTLETLQSYFSAGDPLLRLAAVNGLEMLPPAQVAPLATPFLGDPVLAVRLDAVRLAAAAPANALGPGQRERLLAAIGEFQKVQRENADTPAAWMNLGNLYASIGDTAAAAGAYQSALRLDENFVPAYVNFADLKSRGGDNTMAIALLRSAPQEAQQNAALQHALGLALIRERRYEEALSVLQNAAQAEPDNVRYAYVHGVALHDTGDQKAGIAVLKQALQLHPGDRTLLEVLAAYAVESGDADAAQLYRQKLRGLDASGMEPQYR